MQEEKKIICATEGVRSLATLAVIEFGAFVTASLESVFRKPEREKEVIKRIEEYLIAVGTTTPIYKDLLDTVYDFKSPAYVLAVELLFNKSFKEFRFREYSENVRVAKAIAKQRPSLEYLDLEDLYLDESMYYLFEDILRNCQNLREITLPNTPSNDFWIPLLSTYCPNLRLLDMPYTHGLDYLGSASFRTSLTSVAFHLCDCNDYEYALEVLPVILCCPNVRKICPDINLQGIIENCRKANENFTCNLERLTIVKSDEALLRMVTSACPKLVDFALHSPTDGSLPILSNLMLQNLDITDFEYLDLLQSIKVIGPNLRALQLRSKDIKCVVNICELITYCPMLLRLKLDGVNARFPKQVDTLVKLKKFHMVRSSYSNFELINFLSGLNNLQKFYADEVSITDDDVQSIFCRHIFNDFETLFIRKALNLTVRSVHMLMHSCPNLKYVGQLSEWNISSEDTNSLPCMDKYGENAYWCMYIELYFEAIGK